MISIAVDVRMIRSSGIGTVIANVTSRLLARNATWNFQLIGDPVVLSDFTWTRAHNAQIVEFASPIYTISEQTGFPAAALKESALLWSPNYQTPLRWKKTLLVTVHDMAHLVLPELRNSMLKQFYANAMFARIRNRADGIIYVSQFTADEFHRLVGKPRGCETVIHCGVDESWFQIVRSSPGRPYLLFVGNVKPHKNLSRLLDAFGHIQGGIPHNLLIVGRKEGFITGDADALKRIESFGGRVAFTGYVSDPDLKAIVAGADALILPSLYEGFGLPAIEAMAAGCPALVSRTASLPEVCQDAALYCDPLDAADIAANLKRIVMDHSLRQTLRNRGLARAHALNWDTTAEGYERAIKNLLT